jgi:P4 family phage/plasmid primase-like protien
MPTSYSIGWKAGVYSLTLGAYSISADNARLTQTGNVKCSLAIYSGTSLLYRDAANLGSAKSRAKLSAELEQKGAFVGEDVLLAFAEAMRLRLVSAAKPANAAIPHAVTGGATFALTDYGNAERLVARHGANLRHCHTWGKWLVWTGHRWEIDDTAEVERWAKDTIRSIYSEAGSTIDDAARKQVADHAKNSESRSRLDAMIALAASEPNIPILADVLDADPWLLACENGTIDLRTGQLKPSDPTDYITRLAPVTYDPTAECPTFVAFLDRIFKSDVDLITFIQKAIGYCLTGNTSERCLFILYGCGRNGKSTLQQIMLALFGDYGLRTPTSTLLQKNHDAVPNDVARLQGVRFVAASETDQGRRMAESLVKDLTGQDKISARYMRAEWFDFIPVCKIWLGTNHRPEITGTDKAIWDRVRLVPFDVRIPDVTDESVLPEMRADPDLLDKLKAELPGILAWAVRGCLLWQSERLGWPSAVRKATDKYQADMDVLAGFVDEMCTVNKRAIVPVGALYTAYTKWTDSENLKPIEKRRFGDWLIERGFTQEKKDKGRRFWVGIGLLDDHNSDSEPQTEMFGPSLGGVGGVGGEQNGIGEHFLARESVTPKSMPPVPPVPPTRNGSNGHNRTQYVNTFKPTEDWQDVPDNCVLPNGLEIWASFDGPKKARLPQRPKSPCSICSGTEWAWGEVDAAWTCAVCGPSEVEVSR